LSTSLQKWIRKGEKSRFYRLLGIRIDEVKTNYARLSLRVDRRHIQLLNTVHGGVIATLADSAAAWAIFGAWEMKGVPVTVEMKINFLKPVKSGMLVAEARSIHQGSRVSVSEVDVRDSRGVLVAKSLVTYCIVVNQQH
jgi:uncharacterized protein (TIGR00369 family)